MDKLYNLKLHEIIEIECGIGLRIQKVIGGWNYIYSHGITFVPEKKEVKPKQKEIQPMKFDFKQAVIDLGVEKQIAADWIEVRKKKGAANTATAFKTIKKEIELTTFPANDCIKMAVEKSWSGFKAKWYQNEMKNNNEQNTNDEQPKKINW